MQPAERVVRFVSGGCELSAVLLRPEAARVLVVLGHGAGAGMRHPFMEGLAGALARTGLATFRYQFPYMERGQRRPDPQPVLLETVGAAVEAAALAEPRLALVAGGKSMGGRMTSLAAARRPLPGVRGFVFYGFPLHPAGRPSVSRAAHLPEVRVPMLFLQGSRDALADPALIRDTCAGLGDRADLLFWDGADHGFAVPKRSGKTAADVLRELAEATSQWAKKLP
jgi:predicted alpha/beta-hydrolase family hydrolase